MAEHSSSIDIAAPPGAVFDHLVTPDGLTAWMGTWAELDPRVGGLFAVDIAGYPVRGEYLVVDRPRAVAWSWGYAGSDDLPAGCSRVDIVLTATPGGTRVELTHSNLPDPAVHGHADGWANFLPRLAVATTGGTPGPDAWRPVPDRT
jgi:uncharacterized protein YndB with AHSA1/START domain